PGLLRGLGDSVIAVERHAQLGHLHLVGIGPGNRGDGGVAKVRSGDERQNQNQVFDAARQWTDLLPRIVNATVVDDMPGTRNPSGGWLDSRNSVSIRQT